MKKGQIEVMGLVIVVLLIVIGGLFYLRFALSQSPTLSSSDSSVLTFQSTHLLSALLHLQLSCADRAEDVATLLGYCAQDMSYCGVSSCSYLEKELPPIIKESGIRHAYSLWAVHDDESFFSLGNCALNGSYSRSIESGAYTLRSGNLKFQAHLRFCQ